MAEEEEAWVDWEEEEGSAAQEEEALADGEEEDAWRAGVRASKEVSSSMLDSRDMYSSCSRIMVAIMALSL